MIREGRLSDLSSLLELEGLSFQSDRFNRRQFRYLLQKARGKILVYENEERVVGMLLLLWNKSSSITRIASVAVDPKFRNRGIGTELVLHAEKVALNNGKLKMKLEVRQDNSGAIFFYEGLGYCRIDIRPGYYADGVAGIVYEKTLQ